MHPLGFNTNQVQLHRPQISQGNEDFTLHCLCNVILQDPWSWKVIEFIFLEKCQWQNERKEKKKLPHNRLLFRGGLNVLHLQLRLVLAAGQSLISLLSSSPVFPFDLQESF